MPLDSISLPYGSLTVILIGLLAGYIGAEIAPVALIERMLWPQRSSNGVNAGSLKNALFLSAGGPLHRVAIQAMDAFFKHGLHKGAGRGHLLGTAFFPDTGIPYKLHQGNGKPTENELVRNGLPVRILQSMLDTSALAKQSKEVATMRQQITVSHLELFNFDNVPPQGAIALDAAATNSQTIITLLASELPSFILAGFVGYLWSVPAGLFYLLPVVLKIFSACTAIQREDLIISSEKLKGEWQDATEVSKFEIHIPGEGFQVISGPSELTLPFFRHYGHPIRCRWRELTQMAIVAATGFTYPITLAITVFLMPLQVQALWAAFQIYLIFAMLAVRYGGGELWGTTEERIAQALLRTEKEGKGGMIVLKNRTGELMGAKLTRTLHGSYTDGKAQVSRIVGN